MPLSSPRAALWIKLSLLLGLTAAVTLLIAPHLTVGPSRIQPGDILQETIVIPESVTLEDERSTELRRRQALAEFAPVYDYDAKLKERTLSYVAQAFSRMRASLAALDRAQGAAAAQLRQVALERISTLAALAGTAEDLALTAQEAEAAGRRDAELSGRGDAGLKDGVPGQKDGVPGQKDRDERERVRFWLKGVQGRRAALEARQTQLKARLAELEAQSRAEPAASGQSRPEQVQGVQRLQADFELVLGIALDEPAFQALLDARFGEETEQAVQALLGPLLDLKIMAAREILGDGRSAVQLRNLDTGQQERFEALQTLVDVAQVRAQLARAAQTARMPLPGDAYRAGALLLAQRLVRPNLTENREESERQRQELWRNTSPVYFNLKKGDVVVRAGDPATAQQAEILRALAGYQAKHPRYPQLAGTFLAVLLTLALVYQLLRQRLTPAELRFTRLLLMALLLLTTLALAQLLLLLVPALSAAYDFIPASAYPYLIPAALAPLLASVLLRFEAAVYLGLAVSICLAVMLGNSLPFFLYALLGGAVAAIPMRRFETRFALWQQGVRLSLINLAAVGVLRLLDRAPLGWELLYEAGAALLNGWGVAFLAATLLPLLERGFDITTNLRLLELSNMNQPALRELAVRAPGSYQHSIVVGNLSESAADGIGVNPLLVRVASYYHDLGKMLCPLYFVENQGQRNFHDDLPAKTSARIIINHVRDGLEIARRYKLGRAISDIIAQHHGDSLVRFFFHKAQEELGGAGPAPAPADFRYPGPRPQSKEAGLVMVADVTEAAIRSLDDPQPEEIRQMVLKLATRIYMEGQLDESGLTFNDLNYIEKAFTRMLLSIHHHRIAYPDVQGPAVHPLSGQRMAEAAPQAVPDPDAPAPPNPSDPDELDAHDPLARPTAAGARRPRVAGD
jgi:hypothetical protein